ncbi:MAG: sugar ABC transporter permease [Bacilli bacterium]|nr:sugar ABC transporter permease [Bacilli bacterium]MBN2696026.1 sugar ABC transporter permease [Bacilli bacterium]
MTMLKKMNHPLWFITPYVVLFVTFIIIPVILAIALSFTYFNTIQTPEFIGLRNYIELLTKDETFMQYVLPNTIKFAFIVGPVGYMMSFVLAWMLAQIPHKPRTVLAIVLYSPSMTAGIAMGVVWTIVFSGDSTGYLNSLLLDMQIINEPIQFLTSPDYLMNIMILVSLWGSMGVGFLAMLAGILNIDQSLYEAAYVDGLRNRWQEIFYITIPAMKPQMLFGAVMAVVGTFTVGAIGVQLSGANPTPQYAGQLLVNHIEDFGFIRYLMGYASAISVVLLLMIYSISKVTWSLLKDRG